MDYQTLFNEGIFLVSEHDGDVPAGGEGQLGLYYEDTRHLSELELKLNGRSLILLSSTDADVYRTTSLLTNGDLRADGQSLHRGSVGVLRSRVVSTAVHERLIVKNYDRFTVDLQLELNVGADFADVFEVRGFAPGRSGRMLAPRQREGNLLFSYVGGDGVRRSTEVAYSIAPDEVELKGISSLDETLTEADSEDRHALVRACFTWRLKLAPREEWSLELSYVPWTGGDENEQRLLTYDAEMHRLSVSYSIWTANSTMVKSDNDDFNALLRRSALDLRALLVSYPTGPLPIAGIPWFAVPFGRDSLITCLQTLCFRPELAVGTLRFLAAYQGSKDDPWRDEEPGKIMHELRFGELTGLGVTPHSPYYGSVDSTPLFVMLFAQTLRWTGDLRLYEELMPAINRALEWIDNHGDLDGDGYVEYHRRSERGIFNQGWKDSIYSLLYPDGTTVEPPVALVEVQAYVYAAKLWLASLAEQMGDTTLAEQLKSEAAALKERFNRDYWLEDEGTYAQALDAAKRPIRAVTTNPGHALMCGIVPPERAKRLAERLMLPDMASGWGLRTRSVSDHNYNPMSYHNGSVWPHDNSLVAYGLASCGQWRAAGEITRQLLSAARHYRLFRLPELYCGFGPTDTSFDHPVDYPVSCSPQAWAAGAPYLLLQAILGLEPDALTKTLRVRPHLPPWLGRLEVSNLRVGKSRVHLRVTPEETEVVSSDGVEVLTGDAPG